MQAFNSFKMGDVTELFEWLDEQIGPFEYETPKREPEPHSYFYERRGKGWRFKFITTLNIQDQYPDDFALKRWSTFGVESLCVYSYAVVEIDDEADAVLFKLRWMHGHN